MGNLLLMKNPRISNKERGLLKGAIRRIFGRSDLRRRVVESAIVQGYTDPKRKAVKYWVKCADCGKMEAKSNVQTDHKHPVVPVNSSFAEMSFDTVVNRTWCEENDLQILCLECHKLKTKEENAERRRLKKERK